MTVTATNAFSSATGNGAATAFPYTFAASSASEVAVYVGGVLQASGYTVKINAGNNGGTVTFTNPPANGVAIIISSSPSFMQTAQFVDAGAYLPSAVDGANDEAAIRDIYLKGLLDRAPLVPLSETIGPLPSAVSRKGKYLTFDPVTGDPTLGDAQGTKGDPGGNVMAIGLFTEASTLTIPGGTDIVRTAGYSADGIGISDYVNDIAVDAAYVAANPRSSFLDNSAPKRGFRIAETGNVVHPLMFGAVGDGATDDLAALQAFNNWFFGDGTTVRRCIASLDGHFGIFGTLTIGPSAPVASGTTFNAVVGNMRVSQLNAAVAAETVLIQYFRHGQKLSVTVEGHSTALDFASRTNPIGIRLRDTLSANFGRLSATGFWLAGVYAPSVGSELNDGAHIDMVGGVNIGSGMEGGTWSLKSNWSAPVNSGATASTAQRTQLTLDVLPDVLLDTYFPAGTSPVLVRINGTGQPRYVYGINRAAGTISVYPWLNPADVATGSGTLTWIFGGALVTTGSDSGIVNVGCLNAFNCGVGLCDAALYGSRINSAVVQGCGTGALLGGSPNGSHIGTSIDAYYTESNSEDLVITTFVSTSAFSFIKSDYALNPAKVWVLGYPLNTDGTVGLGGGGIGTNASFGGIPAGVSLPINGQMLSYHKQSLSSPIGAFYQFFDHSMPPIPKTFNLNTQTIILNVVGTSGEYNRLFGYNGNRLTYVGTGANGAPTGSFTFTPPAGGTVNGGAVNANAVFSGFDGPASFEVFHTDTAQLTWIVKLVSGQSRLNTTALGYTTGAGGAVTQLTSKTTAVTLNTVCGQFTTNNAALAAAATATFQVNNSNIAATDTITPNLQSGQATNGTYRYWIEKVNAGNFLITIENRSAGSLSEALVFNFTVEKAVAA